MAPVDPQRGSVDSAGPGRYAFGMVAPKRLRPTVTQHTAAWIALALLALSAQPINAADSDAPDEAVAPVLFVLEHLHGGETVRAAVSAKPGAAAAPNAGRLAARWAIRPGTALTTEREPGARSVELFHGPVGSASLVARVRVRYFRDRGGRWLPHFLIEEEPAVAREGGRWKPVMLNRGTPTLLMLTSNTLPNAFGYFPALEFGSTAGALAIDYWIVR